MYEAKFGAEFGGTGMERKYKRAEWWAKFRRKGLWKDFGRDGKDWESPRDYKTRMGMGELVHEKDDKHDKHNTHGKHGKNGNGKHG